MLRYCDVAVLAALCVTLGGLAAPAGAVELPVYITAALSSTARPPQQMARDAARKPAEVVAFAGIKPGYKIADLAPGDGYFTRILSKITGPQGHVCAFVPQRGFRDIQQQRAEE